MEGLNNVYYELLEAYDESDVRDLSDFVQDRRSKASYKDLETSEILALAAHEIELAGEIPTGEEMSHGRGEYVGDNFVKYGLWSFATWSFGIEYLGKRSRHKLNYEIRGMEHDLERPPKTTEIEQKGFPKLLENLNYAGIPYRTITDPKKSVLPKLEDDIVDAVYSETNMLDIEDKTSSNQTEIKNTMIKGRYFDWMDHENIPDDLAAALGVDLDVFEREDGPNSLIDFYDGEHDKFLREN